MPSLAFIASLLRVTDENLFVETDLSGPHIFLLDVFTAFKEVCCKQLADFNLFDLVELLLNSCRYVNNISYLNTY